MASFIELIAKIKQKNNGTFKLVDAQDVECEDGKGLDEVLNEKLDKNQGIENVGKTMVVGADGNLVVGDSSPKNVYTKEEVDYMLADKMDKPYTSIEITDNATITDALEGNFKIDKIKGNTYQNVETDIVPAPSRPVPINSRKTLVTKANPNMFNFEKENDTSKIPDSGTYRSIGQYQLKPNTKYIFEWSEATVPAKSTLSFQIQDDKGTVLVSPFTYFNLETTEKKEAGKQVEFTTNSSGIVKFAYNCTVGTSSTTETYQQHWYTKILKNITLKEDVEYEPEYVELRSLKETSNLFDKNIMAFTSGTLNSDGTVGTNASYAVSGFVPVEPSTQYTIKVIDGFRGSTKVYYDINKQVISNEATTTFTTPSNCYFVRWQTASTDTRVLTEEDIQKINDEMMMVKGNSLPSSYVAPTVRDYKIVDHTTKTSKIVRNVGYEQKDFSTITPSLETDEKYRYQFELKNKAIANTNTGILLANIAKSNTNDNDDNIFYTTTGYANFISSNNDINEEVTIQYQLATPIEESISYVETDTSEVGYSWQDTTSPSPTIKSEVKGVEKIDILKTGKNLFDINDEDVYLSPNITHNGNQIIKNDGSIFPRIKLKNLVIDKEYTLSYSTKLNKSINNSQLLSAISSKNTGYPDGVVLYKVGDGGTDYNVEIKFTATQSEMYLIFSIQPETITNLQIELGDTATPYEPYQEQHVNITPPQPLYSTVDGSIADEADVEKGVYRYRLLKEKIGNVIDSVMLGSLNGDMQKYFTDTLQDESRVPLSLNDQYDTRNLLCTNYNANIESYMYASNETFSLYMDTTAKFVGCVNINRLNENTTLNIYNFIKDFEIVYPLETPIEIPIPQEDLKLLKSLKTEQGVTNIFVGGEVKPTIEARYPRDLALVQQQLEQKILLISDSLIDTQAKLLLQGGND